jgi:hypothetical protein
VPRWPTWGCAASKFPWSYAENEACYVLQGRVLVTPDGGQADRKLASSSADGYSVHTRLLFDALTIIDGAVHHGGVL